MDIQQIECVLSVSKHLNFSEASYALMMTQSSVSKKIANLEAELGTKLFDRSTHPITLTIQGVTFVKHAEILYQSYLDLRNGLAQFDKPQNRSLTVGSICFGKTESIVDRIVDFKRRFPEINIEIIDGTTKPLIENLLNKHIDIAFVSSIYPMDSVEPVPNFRQDLRFHSYSLSKDPYYLVVNPSHPLAHQSHITYQALNTIDFITLDKRMDVYHNALNHIFEIEGVTPKIVMTSSTARDALTLVAGNVGCAILSNKVAKDAHDVVLVPFENPIIRDTQVLIRNEKAIPTHVRQFYEFMHTESK